MQALISHEILTMFNQNEEETQGSEVGTRGRRTEKKRKGKERKKRNRKKGKECGRASSRPMLSHGPPTP
jgi:hypothetical protein